MVIILRFLSYSMSQAKGYTRERELVNLLDDNGFAATRVPGSGGGTKRPLPDIIAGNGEDIYAIEAKASSGYPIYLKGKEIFDLIFFADGFGAQPRIGIRFDREDWYFFHPAGVNIHKTRGSNYRIRKEIAISYGETLEDLTGTN